MAADGTYLERIVGAHRAATAADERPLDALLDRARAVDDAPRPFAGALRSASPSGSGRAPAVIAEVKRRSPSKPSLALHLDPARLARAYEAGGAVCLSVLTDAPFFGGSPADLAAARGATARPVLRKDFTVGPGDVAEARLMGADAVLLIAAVLDDIELADLHGLARELHLDALVEVHDEAELERAVAVGADLIGVNQRDLTTFAVDPDRARRVAAAMPADAVRVAESGIGSAADCRRLGDAGFHAVLVGEAFVTAADPAAAGPAFAQAHAGRPVGVEG